MGKATVLIGCRSIHGFILDDPRPGREHPDFRVKINGLNRSNIVGANHMTTEVDKEFWDAWYEVHSSPENADGTGKLLSSGAIFFARNSKSAQAQANELGGEKLGNERLDPNAKQKGDQGLVLERMTQD